MTFNSFLNSTIPCAEDFERLFTARLLKSGLYFRSKGNSKIAIKFEGF